MNVSEIASEALQRAQGSASTANYGAIYAGFEAKGIPASEILPRENVLTFHAWKAVGRSVRRGEHGVKVCTWIPMTKKDAQGEAHPIGKKPRMTTVFHISQTDPVGERTEQRANPEPDQPRQTAEAQGFKVEGWINSSRSPDGMGPQRNDAAAYFSDEFTPMGGR